jgi:hypothetical protein
MHELTHKFLQIVHDGLERSSLQSCSKWAEKCRVMGAPFPGPWTFLYHPWLKEMHDTNAEMCVGQKAAQVGFTEMALNRNFYCIDIKRVDCLYVLPAKTPDASDFSASRFDPALELSPYLKNLFSDVKNIGHKRAGSANLFIRGSRSRAGLKSIPISQLTLDEIDEMNKENIPLALERQSGQREKQTWIISTPTVDGFGVNEWFTQSTQEDFMFKCPACSRSTNLIFPDCLEITADDPTDPGLRESHLKCKECNAKLDHEAKTTFLKDGQWVPKYPDRDIRGFHVNQLYVSSVAGRPHELARAYLLGNQNKAAEQEFFNSKLGLPHIVKGARVMETDFTRCISSYKNGDLQPRIGSTVTMGIDVGNWLHYVVKEWSFPNSKAGPDVNMDATARILEVGKVLLFEELDNILQKYRPNMTVIDANPERRKAYELAQRFWGHIKLCFYGNNVNGKTINEGSDDMENMVTVDRTSWLDLTLGRYKNQSVLLPIDIGIEFKEHIKEPVRIYEEDSNKNPVGRYVNAKPDHFAHADNYAEIALPLAIQISTHQTIRP